MPCNNLVTCRYLQRSSLYERTILIRRRQRQFLRIHSSFLAAATRLLSSYISSRQGASRCLFYFNVNSSHHEKPAVYCTGQCILTVQEVVYSVWEAVCSNSV